MNPEIKRRAFLKNTVAAGLTAPLIASTASANPWAAARPVVISSSNNHMGADGKPLNGGIDSSTKRWKFSRLAAIRWMLSLPELS